MAVLMVHTDGGARSNPGPAGVGAVLQMGEWVHEHARTIGIATNNVAEYTALLDALELVAQAPEVPSEVLFHLDSELVVKQVRGEYRVKDVTLQGLHAQVQAKLKTLPYPYKVVHVRREFNKHADALYNAALDAQSR